MVSLLSILNKKMYKPAWHSYFNELFKKNNNKKPINIAKVKLKNKKCVAASRE